MKVLKHILVGTAALLGLYSCTNENLSTTENRMGSMSLNVDKLYPTRAVETNDYPVAIYSLDDNSLIASYERADQVPNKLKMNIGLYYAEAHAPGVMDKIMDAPYYAGRDTFEILQNINTESTVVCRMANGCISVQYSQQFIETFTDWTVTVNDGGGSAIVYTRAEHGLNPSPLYIRFEENVQMLIVNFAGTTVGGNRITTASTLTKQQASERYDSDTKNFEGGDHIVINFEPVEGTEGEVTGITITANIKFEESEEDFEMEVEDFIPEDEEEDDPTEENTAITLNLPKDMVVSGATDPALGNTYIAAEHGIKSILVKITSTSEDMMNELGSLANNYEGVDFAAGAEVVGNGNMVSLFSALGQSLSVPSVGDTEYTFPIGNFFGLLQFLPGEHTFSLTIIDMQDNIKNGFLKLTVE